jgi:hypothetical protein
MQQKLQMVEFGVAGLEEVRTLVKRWKKVLAGLPREDEGPAMVWKTHRPVGIEVEDRGGPGRRCSSPSWPPGRCWSTSWPISGVRGCMSQKSLSFPGW